MKKRRAFNTNIIVPVSIIVTIGFITLITLNWNKSWKYDWNGIRPEVRDTVELIVKDNFICKAGIGYSLKIPNQLNRINWFKQNANNNELYKLLTYPNGTIKALAYECLILRPDIQNKKDLILKALNEESETTNFVSGCIGENMVIGDYIMNQVLYIHPNAPPPPTEIIISGLSVADKEEIIEVFNDNKAHTANNAYNSVLLCQGC